VFRVVSTFAWPSRSLMTLTFAPEAMRWLACVWRRSWRRRRGSRDAASSNLGDERRGAPSSATRNANRPVQVWQLVVMARVLLDGLTDLEVVNCIDYHSALNADLSK
jgi:hypothetical protein